MEHALLRFMGAETPHKNPAPQSTYVYKLDPKGCFGEEKISSCKNDQKKENKKKKRKAKVSPGEKSSREPLDHSKNEMKIKNVLNGENLSEAPKDGYFILAPKDHRSKILLILIEKTRLVNISLTKTPRITYITTSFLLEQVDLLIEVL